MKESRPVVVYLERLYCNMCGEEMKQTGVQLLTAPPKYPHRCPGCDRETIELHQFPRLTFAEVGRETTGEFKP